MIFIFRHIKSISINLSIAISRSTKSKCVFIHQLAVSDPTHTIVRSLCESLRKGLKWDTLSRKYDYVNFEGPLVEKVILQLKEPHEAKRALNFFHWVAHTKKIDHGLGTYCITIHILARARLVKDALGLLESVLQRSVGDGVDDSLKFSAVNVLISTYKITNSSPLIFDLLVQTYSKLSLFKTAFDVCCFLDGHGFPLSLTTFNTLLDRIQKSTDESGLIWKVYGHMIQKRIYLNEVTVMTMINALCKAGELQKIVDIIDRIHGKRCTPMVIVNSSLVFKMLGDGRIEEALVSLKRMLEKNLIHDTISYSFVVYAKLKSQELDSAREVYGEMLSRGFEPNSFVYTVFIEAFCEKGKVEDALNLMEEAASMGVKLYTETYNSLMIGCANTGNLIRNIRLCDEMIEKDFIPSSLAFNGMVGDMCRSGNMKKANEILTLLMERGFSPDETTFCYLIDGYRREGDISEVLKLFYEMEFRSLHPGLSIFTLLIGTLCEHRKLEEAEKFLSIMNCRSLYPTTSIYDQLILAHLGNGNKGRARHLYNEMLNRGLKIIHSASSFCLEDLES